MTREIQICAAPLEPIREHFKKEGPPAGEVHQKPTGVAFQRRTEERWTYALKGMVAALQGPSVWNTAVRCHPIESTCGVAGQGRPLPGPSQPGAEQGEGTEPGQFCPVWDSSAVSLCLGAFP